MRSILIALTTLTIGISAFAQTPEKIISALTSNRVNTEAEEPESSISFVDSLIENTIVFDPQISTAQLPNTLFLPSVFSTYEFPDSANVFSPSYSGDSWLVWIEDAMAAQSRANAISRTFQMQNPTSVRYNTALMPEPPKKFVAVVNPEDHTIDISEIVPLEDNATTLEVVAPEKKHWIKKFDALLQFSQAYVSPNWYQGGNNNLNALLNLYYNVKLNPAFHPNLLFESTFQYKLGMNSTPDDSLRNYNISSDILQINSVFGVKAAKKWYYSITTQFKTQMLNSYTVNTNTLRSAFMSPAELNVGLGMTYNTANAKKTFTFDASISPLSYNLTICTNDNMDVTAYGIDPGKHSVSNYGSSMECKLFCQLTYNIAFSSRLFGFTDYDRAYFDWENNLSFTINKFLSTNLYVHLRYDTDTPPIENPNWHKLQVKEILSLGFAYTFNS